MTKRSEQKNGLEAHRFLGDFKKRQLLAPATLTIDRSDSRDISVKQHCPAMDDYLLVKGWAAIPPDLRAKLKDFADAPNSCKKVAVRIPITSKKEKRVCRDFETLLCNLVRGGESLRVLGFYKNDADRKEREKITKISSLIASHKIEAVLKEVLPFIYERVIIELSQESVLLEIDDLQYMAQKLGNRPFLEPLGDWQLRH
jgi:hypothetical protein